MKIAGVFFIASIQSSGLKKPGFSQEYPAIKKPLPVDPRQGFYF
jgi:hypothetical protein